jgi:hypothetical protein
MEAETVTEIERHHAAFKDNPKFFLRGHCELKSLISNEQISFPQPKKGSKSVLDVCGVRFSCPKSSGSPTCLMIVTTKEQSLGYKLVLLVTQHLASK